MAIVTDRKKRVFTREDSSLGPTEKRQEENTVSLSPLNAAYLCMHSGLTSKASVYENW